VEKGAAHGGVTVMFAAGELTTAVSEIAGLASFPV
jgi:hypothetical protein